MSYNIDTSKFNQSMRVTEIGGKKFTIQLLKASVGIQMFEKITKAIGPAIGVMLDGNREEEVLLPDEVGFFTNLSFAIVKQLHELDLLNTVKVLLDRATVGSQMLDFDTYFSGNYGELVSLVEFALKENFSGFFTHYLKARGLEIPTLRKKMSLNQEQDEKAPE